MSADEAADFARRREDADEEEEQKRSVTPNFSFRSFFEKSDATENEKTKKKNAFQKFMAFEPESVKTQLCQRLVLFLHQISPQPKHVARENEHVQQKNEQENSPADFSTLSPVRVRLDDGA